MSTSPRSAATLGTVLGDVERVPNGTGTTDDDEAEELRLASTAPRGSSELKVADGDAPRALQSSSAPIVPRRTQSGAPRLSHDGLRQRLHVNATDESMGRRRRSVDDGNKLRRQLSMAQRRRSVEKIKDRYAGLRIGQSLPGDVVILLRQCATADDEGAIIGDLLQVHEGREETMGELATAYEMPRRALLSQEGVCCRCLVWYDS